MKPSESEEICSGVLPKICMQEEYHHSMFCGKLGNVASF
jgi:hypothetical protein